MKFSRIVLTTVFSLVMILAGLPLTMAQPAATDSTFTSLLSGAVIDLGPSGEASFVEGSHDIVVDRGARQEEIVIAHGQSKIFVAIVDPGVSVARWDEDSIGNMAPWNYSFEVLGAGSEPGSSWTFWRYAYYLNLEELAYGEFQEAAIDDFGLAVMVFGDESTVVEQISWVQQNVTVDGLSAVRQADLPELQAMVAGTSAIQPHVVEGHGTTAADWKDYGVVSESEWVSPTCGTVITWDTSHWGLRYYKSNAIVIATDEQADTIYLVPPDNRGVATVRIYKDPEERTPAQWVERWTSEEYLATLSEWNYVPINSVLSDTTGSTIYSLVQVYGEPVIQIRDVYIDADGNTVITSIYASPEDIGSVYEDFWNSVTADGQYYPLTWTIEEIKALSEV